MFTKASEMSFKCRRIALRIHRICKPERLVSELVTSHVIFRASRHAEPVTRHKLTINRLVVNTCYKMRWADGGGTPPYVLNSRPRADASLGGLS